MEKKRGDEGVLRGAVEGRLHAEGDVEIKLEGRKEASVQRQDPEAGGEGRRGPWSWGGGERR